MLIELWKDADGYRVGFDGSFEFDVSHNAYDKLLDILELFRSKDPGEYHTAEFDVMDSEEGNL